MLENIESSTANRCRFFAEKTPKAPWHIELDEHGLLRVTLDETAQSGSIVALPITVDYGNGKLHTALTLRASDSKRMLPRVPSQRLSVKAGERITVDLLQHAYNPFSRSPLRITELAGDKRTVNASLHGSKLTIAPSRGVGAVSTVLHATVSDATNDPARQIQCTIAVTITDVPSSPLLLPVRSQPRHDEVELQWIAGAAHGSPIDDYEVLYDGHRQSCGTAGFCRIKRLRNGTAYEFRLRAHNDVGWSPYSDPVIATPDTTPTAPDQVRVESGYRQVTVSWNAPDYTGSAPQGYTVTIRGAQTQTVTLPSQVRSHSFTLTHQQAQGIYTASVTAHNRVGKGATATASDSQQPWSDPDAPRLSLRIDPDDPKTVIGTVTLPELHGAGCRTLTVERVKGNFCTNNESFSIPITEKDADTMRITARLTPEKPHAEATQTTATIQLPPRQTTPEPDPSPTSPSASETSSPARKESQHESLG